MECKHCKREIDDDSLYCKFCGMEQFKIRRKSKELSVPKPRQLPSGSWTIYLDREHASITESTARKCEDKAKLIRRKAIAKRLLEIEEESKQRLTLGEAIDRYITDRSEVFSPSTQRSYWSIRNHRMQDCMEWNIYDPANNWQAAINQELVDGLSPKTVKNVWRLCSGAIRNAGVAVPNVTLKRTTPAERQWLRYDQIEVFLDAIKDQDCELAALLALHSLRLSELLALKPGNVSLKTGKLLVRGSRVLNSDNLLVFKELNKTDWSRREIDICIPRLTELLKEIPKTQEWVVDSSEKHLYDKVNRICAANGLPKVGIHGLRHSFASLCYHLGLKEMTVMQMGGWSDSSVVRDIYTHNSDYDQDVQRIKDFYNSENRNEIETDT